MLCHSVSSFSIVHEYSRTFKYHHRPKCKRLSATSCWEVPRNLTCFPSHTDGKNFSLIWCGKITPEICPKLLDTTRVM